MSWLASTVCSSTSRRRRHHLWVSILMWYLDSIVKRWVICDWFHYRETNWTVRYLVRIAWAAHVSCWCKHCRWRVDRWEVTVEVEAEGKKNLQLGCCWEPVWHYVRMLTALLDWRALIASTALGLQPSVLQIIVWSLLGGESTGWGQFQCCCEGSSMRS